MSWFYNRAAHNFMRNPNYNGSLFKRSWTKGNPLENTVKVLEDPKTGKTVYLIGTTNSSTVLADRTRRLIHDVQPDSLHVQTCDLWYDRVRHALIENQEQMNAISPTLTDLTLKRVYDNPNNVRGLYFKARLLGWITYMNFLLSFPSDFNPWRPGAEMLWAIKACEAKGAKINYLGQTFNTFVVEALANENNISPLTPFLNIIRGESFSRWRTEERDFWGVLKVNGGAAFAEHLDDEYISWFSSWFERKHPNAKRVLVDDEDVRIFKKIRGDNSKTVVAIVNHWHLPGIETHWKRSFKQVKIGEPINPIGDMDIDAIQEANLVNDMLRNMYSRIERTEPAAGSNYLTHYKKSVMEPERERHVLYDGVHDHHMEHGLYQDQNKHVSYMEHEDHSPGNDEFRASEENKSEEGEDQANQSITETLKRKPPKH